ncbi:hypothetical protein KR093_007976, partial [Drosophila rubida]
CSAYVTCRNGCSDKAYCIPEKLFNPLLHICDTPRSVACYPKPYPTPTTATTAATTEQTPTTSSTTTTTATTNAPLPPDVDPDVCEGLPDYSRLPIASNCSQYVQCKDNEAIVGQCSNGLLFNPDWLICDEANDETSTTQETSTTSEGTSTTTTPSGICGGKPLGALVPYPNNCDKYIVCDEPIPIGYDCPEGLEFSPTELECMHPDLANCSPK